MTLKRTNNQKIILTALFSALIAAGAFIKIPIPVIPFTLQTLFVVAAGLVLGSKGGALASGLYLILGLIGLPIFTQGGGIFYVLQPTFGYLVGFVFAGFFTGLIMEKSANPGSIKTYLVASGAGLFCLYLLGVTYLYIVRNVYMGSDISLWSVLVSGFFVTIPGDLALAVSGALIIKKIKPVLMKMS